MNERRHSRIIRQRLERFWSLSLASGFGESPVIAKMTSDRCLAQPCPFCFLKCGCVLPLSYLSHLGTSENAIGVRGMCSFALKGSSVLCCHCFINRSCRFGGGTGLEHVVQTRAADCMRDSRGQPAWLRGLQGHDSLAAEELGPAAPELISKFQFPPHCMIFDISSCTEPSLLLSFPKPNRGLWAGPPRSSP